MPEAQQTIESAQTAGDAAAMWWVSALRDPKQDNGSDDPMIGLLAALNKEGRPGQSDDNLHVFATFLADHLNRALEDNENNVASQFGIRLDVDYHPDHFLSTCADAAGLRSDINDWPWKTGMIVKRDEVSVSCGYGAPIEVIWTKSS